MIIIAAAAFVVVAGLSIWGIASIVGGNPDGLEAGQLNGQATADAGTQAAVTDEQQQAADDAAADDAAAAQAAVDAAAGKPSNSAAGADDAGQPTAGAGQGSTGTGGGSNGAVGSANTSTNTGSTGGNTSTNTSTNAAKQPAASTTKPPAANANTNANANAKTTTNTTTTPPAASAPAQTAPAAPSALYCTLSIEAKNFDKGVILAPTKVEFKQGETVFDVLQRECKARGIQMEFNYNPMYKSVYIEGIHNYYEFDGGSLSGWMYEVNGWYPNYGCSVYVLKDGDVFGWHYTCDLGKDLGAEYAVGQKS